jgi:hypothetical protein
MNSFWNLSSKPITKPFQVFRSTGSSMKRIFLACAGLGAGWALAGCLSAGYASIDPRPGGGDVVVTVGAFHDTLGPYGEWVNSGSYGMVWRPSVAVVGPSFQPYATGGHWVYSDVGWTWASDWDWGWAPFHYGRWVLDPVYGWAWIPDTVWGPAWVSWRFGGGLVGWAPLGPAGVVVETYHPYWCFVGQGHLLEPNVFQYTRAVDYHQAFAVTAQLNSTVLVNNTTRVWAGPPVGQIQTATGRPITPVHIGAPMAGVIAPHTVNGVPAPQVPRPRPGFSAPSQPGVQRPGAATVPANRGAWNSNPYNYGSRPQAAPQRGSAPVAAPHAAVPVRPQPAAPAHPAAPAYPRP